MSVAIMEITEARATEFAELLTECAELSLTLTAKRSRLEQRLGTLEDLTEDLELAVARAREAVARGEDFDDELSDLRRLQGALRRELPARAA